MPRGKGKEALAIWAKRREDAVRQQCGNRWHTKDAMVALGIFLDVKEVSEWIALMAASRRDRYEQRGSNGGSEFKLYSKNELEERAQAEFSRLLAARTPPQPQPGSALEVATHGSPAPVRPPPPAEVADEVVAALVPEEPEPTPPTVAIVPADSPAAGASYPNLAGMMSVQVMVLTVIFQAVRLGWIATTALRAAIQRELGWENSTPQGIGRMLGLLRDSLGFLESRDDGSVRDYRVSRLGAVKVLGMTETELEALGSAPPPPPPPAAPSAASAPEPQADDDLKRQLAEMRDRLEGIEDWYYQQTVSRIVTELMGFPPEAREGILADVHERMK